MNKDALITDESLFPRSEYYTRFSGTTAFKMDNPDYWGNYHRGQKVRAFQKMGGRNEIHFFSPCAKKPLKANSFHAHTGGVLSPFSSPYYNESITMTEQASESDTNVRDMLLLYKQQMAERVVKSFEKGGKNSQKIKKRGKAVYLRPVVIHENNYPCVLVALPVLNPTENTSFTTRYWASHPKPFQRLLMASFIAYLNVAAMEAGIPIEMVIRASFGHNLPSICETANTFRINVGLIPGAYADLIGVALQKLNKSINLLANNSTLAPPFKAEFYATVRQYNAGKLKKSIDSKPRYVSLKNTRDYKTASQSDEAFDRLYQEFCNLNNLATSATGRANFNPVRLRGATVWDVICETGDSKGRPVLAECFRENETVDWFANAVMDALLNKNQKSAPIEYAMQKLLSHLSYGEKATMNYAKIREALKKEKRNFEKSSFQPFYKSDSKFSTVTNALFTAFDGERPNEGLYSDLERAGVNFYTTYRGSDEVEDDADFGSDSECSVDLPAEETENEKSHNAIETNHASHGKLRVCSGMKAVVLAQYGALAFLKQHGASQFKIDVEQMYFEVEEALKMVKVTEPVKNKVRANVNNSILHFDLNHCNASNAANNADLDLKLKQNTPSIVVLDYTSSTIQEINAAAEKCFSQQNIELVILIDSGLKNNQGGQDFNPYGEVRVMARDREACNFVLKTMTKGLSDEDKLPPAAHEMVRASKRKGLAPSLYGFFNDVSTRFEAPELDSENSFQLG